MAAGILFLLVGCFAPPLGGRLLGVAHSAVTSATGRTLDRMATIGTAGDHGLARLAPRGLDLATGVANFLACRALGFDRVGLHVLRLVAGGFRRMREGHECEEECDRSE